MLRLQEQEDADVQISSQTTQSQEQVAPTGAAAENMILLVKYPALREQRFN